MPGKPNQLYCKGCKAFKDIDNFYERKSVKRGYQTNCKACANEAKKPKPELTAITFEDISKAVGAVINQDNVKEARIVDCKALNNGDFNVVVKGSRKGKVITVSIKGLCI